jgi:hypothetical protein
MWLGRSGQLYPSNLVTPGTILHLFAFLKQISEGQKGADAQVLVDTVDRERGAFIKNYFHADWPNRSLYHAMVNTDAGEQTVIQAILSFLQQNRPGYGLQRTA